MQSKFIRKRSEHKYMLKTAKIVFASLLLFTLLALGGLSIMGGSGIGPFAGLQTVSQTALYPTTRRPLLKSVLSTRALPLERPDQPSSR
jgi:hypothetical protein